MSTCEMCWYLAQQDAQKFGGSVADHYHRRITEIDDYPHRIHPGHTQDESNRPAVVPPCDLNMPHDVRYPPSDPRHHPPNCPAKVAAEAAAKYWRFTVGRAE